MAEPVSLTTEELFAKIGQLQMECNVRAAREDALKARISELEEAKKKGSEKSVTT